MSIYGKKWYKSKMLWANILTSLISLAEIIHQWLTVGDFSSAGVTALMLGILNFSLRLVTSEAIR